MRKLITVFAFMAGLLALSAALVRWVRGDQLHLELIGAGVFLLALAWTSRLLRRSSG